MTCRTLISILTLLLPCLSPVAGQEAGEITPRWIQSDACRDITRLPFTQWLDDGTLLILESGDGNPGFSILDPANGERAGILDMRKALTRLGGHLKKTPGSLPTPTGIARNGERALYTIDGDLLVLDLATARFRRITRTPEVEWSVQFSPDSKMVSFVRDNDLYAHDIDSGKTLRLTKDGSENILNGTLSWVYWEEIFGRRDIGYWWSHDSRSIAFLRTDESMVTEMTYVDFLPETPAIIHQKYPKAGTTNPVVRVGVVSVSDAPSTRWVNPADHEYEYICRVDWMPGDARIAIQTMNRSQTELDLWFVDSQGGKAAHILKETDDAWVNINDDLNFLKDGKHFLWVSERSGFAHIYRYSLDGKLVNAVTKGDWALRAANPVFWVRKAVQAIDEESGHVFFTALKESSLEKHLYRVALDGSGLKHLTPKSGTWSILFSRDAKHYAGTYSSTHTPPSLSLFRADGKSVAEIAAARTDLTKNLGLVYPELFSVKTPDGFAMPAMIYKPEDFDPSRRWPVILHTYGGPSAPMVSNGWQRWIYFNTILACKGFIVVTIDNRSATAISKTLENTILGQMSGDHELADIAAGVKWIKAQPWADPDRVGIWGWSNGGMLTLLGMTRTKAFRAGISVAPVTRWEYYDTKWGETVNKLPAANPEGYKNTDLTRRAKDLHGRLLLVHGTADDNVHIQHTWHFVDELIHSGKLFELMIYPMRKHGIGDAPAQIHLLSTMLSFWERNL